MFLVMGKFSGADNSGVALAVCYQGRLSILKRSINTKNISGDMVHRRFDSSRRLSLHLT